jgi:hypothetical protein
VTISGYGKYTYQRFNDDGSKRSRVARFKEIAHHCFATRNASRPFLASLRDRNKNAP